MDNLFIKPYNYLLSFTEYITITIPNTNNISNIITKISDNTYNIYESDEIINDTIETSINDINNKSLSDITFNDIIYVFYEYKIFILIMTLFTIFTIYLIDKIIDDYLMRIDNKNTKTKQNIIKNTINHEYYKDYEDYLQRQKHIQIQTIIRNKEKLITKGLFIDSVLEINANNKNISQKIMINEQNNNYFYYALVRIKLKHNITLNKTNYNIETIIINTDNYAETFSTSDMYMIIKFHHNHNYTDIKLSQFIIDVMNILNNLSKDEYKNEDFVVLAISKDSINYNTNPYEFYNGLQNINYDILNIKNIQLDKENKIGFTLLLPIKQIYELFLDVYNDIIFESTSYKIDFDNNEYWYNNSINDIF